MSIPVGLSTACVVPGSVPDTFAIAQELGYDGVEIMVWSEKASQDATRLASLVEKFDQPVLRSTPHAAGDPRSLRSGPLGQGGPLHRAGPLPRGSHRGAAPPFFWQTRYARSFIAGVAQREATTGIHLAVENMFTWRPRHAHSTRDFQAYSPTWDPVGQGYKSVTLDISHAATSGSDAWRLPPPWGRPCATST